jgi:dipeptidyl aminopeptidase/acylaminoacyl peptidase
VVETARGREQLTIQDPRGFVSSAAVSPDGRWIATATADPADYTKGWATLRDARTGRPLRDLSGFDITSRIIAFRPDGRAIAYGGKNALLVRGVEDGAELLTIGGFEGVPRSPVFGADGRLVAAILFGPDEASIVKVWDAESGRAERTLRGTERDSVVMVTFSPDARRLATGDFKAQVRIWDVASGEELLTLKGHTSWVWALAFSPDGRRLYSGGLDRTVRVWETETPAPLRAATAQPDADWVRQQAIALERRERYGEAERLWRRFLEIARQRRLDDDPLTYSAESRLGACLSRLGRHEEAEGYLLRSYRAARAEVRILPEEQVDYRKRVEALYESWGRFDRAAAWRAEELDAVFPADPFAGGEGRP